MNINTNIRLKFITPCFCAGADPLVAEIRAPSIRGELRWWFRCLGGDNNAENAIFGSVAGAGRASAIQVRVANVTRAHGGYSPTHAKLEDPGSYLHFYLDQPPKDGKSRLWLVPPCRRTGKKGVPRPEACLPAESAFELQITRLGQIPPNSLDTLLLAIEAMCRLGSLGFRHTRGFGAWHRVDKPITTAELDDLIRSLKRMDGGFEFWISPNSANTPAGLLNQVESKLKEMRKPTSTTQQPLPAKDLTSLGHAGVHGRQASAVRFRPVQIQTKAGDAQYKLVIFQAPDCVLGADVKEPRRIVPKHVPR